MAKQSISKLSILKGYQDYLLEEGKKPESVRIFTKYLKISDEEFFNHFNSLGTIESAIWEGYFTRTLEVINKDPEFEEMSSREKHLSFLYTLLEIIKQDRAYLLLKLEDKKAHQLPEELLKTRKLIENSEIDWAKTFQFLPQNTENITRMTYKRVLWSHIILLIFFWIKDDSPEFKDTDIFIEKTTRTAFDIGELPAVDSIFDLSKFFIQKMGFTKYGA